ncbi:MAG: hypothetical protein Q7T21_09770 [Gallionella sp.]|nr:hypothetical protein [Gallionella sp.]
MQPQPDTCCVPRQLIANRQPLLVFRQTREFLVVIQLLSPRLHREISLPVGNHRLGRIAVLHDQITGITRQVHIGDFAPGARANSDHFGDITEMVIHDTPGLLASQPGFLHHLHKISPILIFQQGSEVAGKPIFVAAFVNLADAFKGGVMLFGNALVDHGVFPVVVSKAREAQIKSSLRGA